MSKYIVKNCPCCDIDGFCCFLTDDNEMSASPCKITDCLIKQVIEMCKKECDPLNDDWCRVKENLSNEILQLFEIEECTE